MFGGLSALELFGAFGTAVTIFGGGVQIGRKFYSSGSELRKALHNLKLEQDRSSALADNFESIRSVLDDETDVWLRSPPDLGKHITQIRSSIPIITVCNFKGGVGKTTLTSMLAGYFDLYKYKRVLLVDFDYQGSLTDALLGAANLPHKEASSPHLIEGGKAAGDAVAHAYPLHPVLSATKIFTSFYVFNRLENRVMMRWIADNESDARYATHRVLSDPAVQNNFDIVIIDAPPRLSTGTVNAFCASTHVLIPTILDSMSTQAALNTLKVVEEFRAKLNPGLEVLGIVPTLVNQIDLNQRELDHLERMVARLPEYWGQAPPPHVFKDTRICRKAAISGALGTALAYSATPAVRSMTIALGDAITERLFHDSEVPSDPPPASRNVSSNDNAGLRV